MKLMLLRFVWAIVTIVVLTFLVIDRSYGDSVDSIKIISIAEGKVYTSRVTREQISITPSWEPGADVPLSPSVAETKANKVLNSSLQNAGSYILFSICLQKSEKFWYYNVTFVNLSSPVNGLGNVTTPFSVIVLLDGTAVLPAVSKL